MEELRRRSLSIEYRQRWVVPETVSERTESFRPGPLRDPVLGRMGPVRDPVFSDFFSLKLQPGSGLGVLHYVNIFFAMHAPSESAGLARRIQYIWRLLSRTRGVAPIGQVGRQCNRRFSSNSEPNSEPNLSNRRYMIGGRSSWGRKRISQVHRLVAMGRRYALLRDFRNCRHCRVFWVGAFLQRITGVFLWPTYALFTPFVTRIDPI